MPWVEYHRELAAARGREDGGAYEKGLRRGFEGARAVSDTEHRSMMSTGGKATWNTERGC